ncbi:STAS domain-containing protein [Streptomyces sp. NRRL F-2580]|uniref:STAS domain-containing protein n=1 Tax=Streptomyces sp. NRRL F-2580 TaxID=1463841 RepID=UPI00068A4B97
MAHDREEARVPLVRVERGERGVVVRVSGEIDLDRAPQLRDALHTVITRPDGPDGPDGPDEIVVDLAELTFCDSSGLNALLQARLTAQEHGRRIRLHAPASQVMHLLELTGAQRTDVGDQVAPGFEGGVHVLARGPDVGHRHAVPEVLVPGRQRAHTRPE